MHEDNFFSNKIINASGNLYIFINVYCEHVGNIITALIECIGRFIITNSINGTFIKFPCRLMSVILSYFYRCIAEYCYRTNDSRCHLVLCRI